jgi:hypothetical protein
MSSDGEQIINTALTVAQALFDEVNPFSFLNFSASFDFLLCFSSGLEFVCSEKPSLFQDCCWT